MSPYTKVGWVDGTTPVNAAKLGQMDQGIKDLDDLIAGGVGSSIEYENVWSPAIPYQAGDVVIHNGVQYLAVNDSTGSAPVPAGGGATVPVPVVGIGTALPGAPLDGEEFILVDSLTAPTYQWHFRYMASVTDAYKWVFVGGASAYSEAVADEQTSSTTYVALATPGPSLALPRAGDYLVEQGFLFSWNSTTVRSWMSYDIGATAAVDADSCEASPGQGGAIGANSMQSYRKRRKTLTAVTLTAKYRNTGGAGYKNRWMAVTPVRVA